MKPKARSSPSTQALAPRVARLISFLGCALSVQSSPAAAQVTTAVPPSRAGHVAAPPWSGVSGNPPHPLTRARVAPPASRHPAIHALEGPVFPRQRLFPRAEEVQREKRERRAAMERHPAGKGSKTPTDSQVGVSVAPPVAAGTPVSPPSDSDDKSAAFTSRPRSCDIQTYRVRPGDSLWKIASSISDGVAAAEVAELTAQIFEVNRETVGPNPDLIYPGQSLSLPKDCQK